MPSVPIITRRRQLRRLASHQSAAGRVGMAASLIISLIAVIASLYGILLYTDITRDLPSPKRLPVLLDPPDGALLHPTRLYDRSGQHILLTLENPATGLTNERRYLSLDNSKQNYLPDNLIKATITAIEPNFWKSPGFSLIGIGRGGHPTLAQRLVSDLLLWDEAPGLRRDLRERLLAAQITAQFGREKVLEWYLNYSEYGDLIYGADAASQAYYAKQAKDLSLAEAALLVAVAEAPELDPQKAPQFPLKRQKDLIDKMQDLGLISIEQASQAKQDTIQFRKPITENPELAPAFDRLVLEQLATRFPISWILRGGMQITTSIDYDLQQQAVCTSKAQTSAMSTGARSSNDHVGENCEASRLLTTLPIQGLPGGAKWASSLIILDPRTGHILAMVGDQSPGLDPVRLPGHPPGTLVTPFVYLAAFSKGWSPASLLWDIPSATTAEDQEQVVSTSRDHENYTYHGPVSLRSAMANDYLVPAVSVIDQIGTESILRISRQLGMPSLGLENLQGDPVNGQAFTNGEVTLLEATQAYAVLANQGILTGQTLPSLKGALNNEQMVSPLSQIAVLRMQDTNHQIWLDCGEQPVSCSPQSRPVISPQLAYLVTNVLSDETARWPSLRHPNQLEIGRPAGAKIGYVPVNHQGWTIGYTPEVAVGVWFGIIEDSLTGSGVVSSDLSQEAAAGASGLWHAMIQYASRDQDPDNWNPPEGIVYRDVCDPSGLLPTSACPNVTNEIFISGNEPVHADSLYRLFMINKDTGRLATVFTPPELVVKKVYMVVPSEASQWAQQAGLPTPPDSYDVLNTTTETTGLVSISSPAMFSYVNGKVKIMGSAGGDGFDYYRLQAGTGLNPQQWLKIGSDNTKAMQNGLLGEWDTGGLNGLYSLQLIVVRKDQRVDTAIIQLTVDNQPPKVKILQPLESQVFSYASGKPVIFATSVEDNLALERVEYWIDKTWVATLVQTPYVLAWKPQPGEHILICRVYDMAGNSNESTVRFSVNPK